MTKVFLKVAGLVSNCSWPRKGVLVPGISRSVKLEALVESLFSGVVCCGFDQDTIKDFGGIIYEICLATR